jgi:hypothetical protein
MVFAHEAAHLRRRDALSSLYVFACFAAFYFHPLVWLAKREWQHDREAACDAEAINSLNADRSRYAEMLIKVSAAGAGTPILALSAAPSFHTLHRRIIDMKHANPKNRGSVQWTLLAAVMAMAAAPITLVPRSIELSGTETTSSLRFSSPEPEDSIPASTASARPVAQTAQGQNWIDAGGGVRIYRVRKDDPAVRRALKQAMGSSTGQSASSAGSLLKTDKSWRSAREQLAPDRSSRSRQEAKELLDDRSISSSRAADLLKSEKSIGSSGATDVLKDENSQAGAKSLLDSKTPPRDEDSSAGTSGDQAAAGVS